MLDKCHLYLSLPQDTLSTLQQTSFLDSFPFSLVSYRFYVAVHCDIGLFP